MSDVIRLLGGTAGVDHLTVAGLMARTFGVTPPDDGTPPVRNNLARFGIYADHAARLGLSPDQTERAAREVNESPERRIGPKTRAELAEQIVKASGVSPNEADREVNRLEVAARLLPNEIMAYGTMSIPRITVEPDVKVEPHITVETHHDRDHYDEAMRSNASMSGREGMLGGEGR